MGCATPGVEGQRYYQHGAGVNDWHCYGGGDDDDYANYAMLDEELSNWVGRQ